MAENSPLNGFSQTTAERYRYLLDKTKAKTIECTEGRYPGFIKLVLFNEKTSKSCFLDFCGDTDVCYFGPVTEESAVSYTGTIRELESYLIDFDKGKI